MDAMLALCCMCMDVHKTSLGNLDTTISVAVVGGSSNAQYVTTARKQFPLWSAWIASLILSTPWVRRKRGCVKDPLTPGHTTNTSIDFHAFRQGTLNDGCPKYKRNQTLFADEKIASMLHAHALRHAVWNWDLETMGDVLLNR